MPSQLGVAAPAGECGNATTVPKNRALRGVVSSTLPAPPDCVVVLSTIVENLTLVVPERLQIPPPSRPDEVPASFSVTVEFVTFRLVAAMPPPAPPAWLSTIVDALIVTV